jgi:hypothetical protein
MEEKTFEGRLTFLEESKNTHFQILKVITSQFLAPIDIYSLMVLRRSISLVYGFTELIRSNNFMCAVPLIRFQIDNLLRFRAAFLVDNQSKFVVDVLQGKEVRKLKDRSGKNMTDAYLQDLLENEYSWLKEVYKKTSGYIHLSESHFYNTLRSKKNGQKGTVEIYIGPDDKMVNDLEYEQATEDMINATHALLTFLVNWAKKKGQ